MTAEALLTAEVCRITVVGPSARADLAVPTSLTVSALLPALLAKVQERPGPAGTHPAASLQPGSPWVLQRLGEAPLDPDGTPETLGLRHGETLYLRPADAPLASLQFDDTADGIAHVLGERTDRWQPAHTRHLSLALAVLALAALLWALAGFGPGAAATSGAGAVAALLLAGCVLAHRFRIGAGATALTGVGALAFAAAAGLAFRSGAHGHFTLDRAETLTAAAAVAVVALVLLALRALPLQVTGTALLLALCAAVGGALLHTGGLSAGQATAAVAVGLFAAGHFGPRLALRAARLRAPQLPNNAEELQQDIDPEPLARMEQRVGVADAWLAAIGLASGVVWTLGLWCMVRQSGWIGWVLPLLLAAAALLRARNLTGLLQRVPAVVAGSAGLALLLVVRVAPLHGATRGLVVAVLALAAAALVLAAWRLPDSRLLPVWAHTGDLLETVSAIALLPLLLQALGVYAWFRSLAG